MIGLKDIFAGLVEPVTGLIGKFVEDKDKKNELTVEVERLLDGAAARADDYIKALLREQASIIKTEATGHSWLQRNWRPLMMLWFGALLGLYWFGVTPPNLTEATIHELFGLLKLGIGGYVIGRSAEKVVPKAVEAFRK